MAPLGRKTSLGGKKRRTTGEARGQFHAPRPVQEGTEEQAKAALKAKIRKLEAADVHVDLSEGEKLEELVAKWRAAAQETLVELLKQAQTRDEHITMVQIMKQLHIDPVSVRFNTETEDFEDE